MNIDIREEGYNAYWDCKTLDECPGDYTSDQQWEWNDGWWSACEEDTRDPYEYL